MDIQIKDADRAQARRNAEKSTTSLTTQSLPNWTRKVLSPSYISNSRRRGSASSDTVPFAVELHRASADGEVSGRLELLHERCRARSQPELPAFRDGLVRMR